MSTPTAMPAPPLAAEIRDSALLLGMLLAVLGVSAGLASILLLL